MLTRCRFKWLQCHIESLVLQKTLMAIKDALDAVLSTLEQSYCKVRLRIPKEDRPLAKEALLWLAFHYGH